MEKIEIVKIKRKRNQKGKKNKDKKRYLNHIKKDMNKIKQAFGIVNGKLNIGFDENKESNEIKINSENLFNQNELFIFIMRLNNKNRFI